MTTSSRCISVSLAAWTVITLGACASIPALQTEAGCTSAVQVAPVIRFDNEGREPVHVYLVSQDREWSLGRVEPGAATKLRIPPAALTESAGFMRLAVTVGERAALRVGRDPRAQMTIAQPPLHILSQRWGFGQGQLTPHGFRGAGDTVGKPCGGDFASADRSQTMSEL